MKHPKWYRRYCFMCNIEKKIQLIELMGCYRFIGEWGNHVQQRYNMLIKHYNRTKFWWQRAIRIR